MPEIKFIPRHSFSDQTGKGETGWGNMMQLQGVLVAKVPKTSDMGHSAVIYWVFR